MRRAGNRVAAIGIAALGIAAGIVGEADDAPGLVLLGILLIVSACALGVRTRGSRPDSATPPRATSHGIIDGGPAASSSH